MTVSAIKPERKWLGWSVQSGVERSKIRVGPVAGTINRSQLVPRMPEPRSGVAKRLDRCAERRHDGIDGVLLGECRLKRSFQYKSTAKISPFMRFRWEQTFLWAESQDMLWTAT